MQHTITRVLTSDIRFPTSASLAGSDAMHTDPDYSAAYAVVQTDHPDGLEGHGLTFTIGRGNELCVQAIGALAVLIEGRTLESFAKDMAGFWRLVTGDSQYRWLGPEKGVIHLAAAALVNAVWDLYAKVAQKPLWRLVADMTPEQLVACIDFTYLTDALTPEEALDILRKHAPSKRQRIDDLMQHGYPAYTTSPGWLGYSDDKVRRLARQARADGWTHVKMKVGAGLENDLHRAALIRAEIGDDVRLMMDANQKWEVDEAITHMAALARFDPWWIEEPTSPDDILGHKAIAEAVRPIKVATGEHCQNRVIFKQLITSGAIDVCQVDACRLGGVNEVLAVLLLAAKYDVPVCPHAGGVGLCEYVQHLSMIDYVCISARLDDRIIEYVDHLHEHFVDPVVIVDGAYVPPERPGYSIEMKPESRAAYAWPGGAAWTPSRRAPHA